ncbi:F-box protein SKIP14-like [Wolffia australiana]
MTLNYSTHLSPPPSPPVCEDLADLLPADPFGMGGGADSTKWTSAIASWVEEIAIASYPLDSWGLNFVQQLPLLPPLPPPPLPTWLSPVEAPAASVADADGFCRYRILGSSSLEMIREGGDYLLPRLHKEKAAPPMNCASGNSAVHELRLPVDFVPHCKQNERAAPPMDRGAGRRGEHGAVCDSPSSERIQKGVEYLLPRRQKENAAAGGLNCGGGGGGSGAVPDAVFFALGYLKVPELLKLERVCKTLKAAVREDPLLWRCVHVGPPYNRITNGDLLRLTRRAQGRLQCLALTECPHITNNGLGAVVGENLKLRELRVPGCIKITSIGIMKIFYELKLRGSPGIKKLAIGGIHEIRQQDFEELKVMLGVESQPHPQKPSAPMPPRFFHLRHLITCGNDAATSLDVEPCPVCDKIRLIYDCPLVVTGGNCGSQGGPPGPCRACRLCINRCAECGRCIRNDEYDENYMFEWVCFPCMNYPPLVWTSS